MTGAKTPLESLEDLAIDHRFKGIPLGASLALRDIAHQGWNVARGDLALPVTTLRESALANNLAVMSDYCARNGVLFAPHGKTTMAPQLFARQIAAGAWGLSAATPTQVAVMRQFGATRILMANEIAEASAVRWIAREMETDDKFDFLTLVDNAVTIAMIEAALEGVLVSRTFPVLIEIGPPDGRGGVRDLDQAMQLARLVASSERLSLAGIEFYEDVWAHRTSAQTLQVIDKLCALARLAIETIEREDLFEASPVIVSAGGSAYFDRIVERLRAWPEVERAVTLVLRSGCYLTHDLGEYHASSPFDGRRDLQETSQLLNALEGWAVVVSQPEPGVAILGAGKRDFPYDAGLPIPLRSFHLDDDEETDLQGRATVTKMMDQHLFLKFLPGVRLLPTDIVSFGLSHPCSAFDKFRLLPIVSDNHVVLDAAVTYF